MDFPTLARGIDLNSFTEEPITDPTLRSEAENGKVITRARFTSMPLRWSFGYRFLPAADKTLLDTLQSTVNVGGASFNWTHPITSTVYDVRLLSPIKYTVESTKHLEYSATLEIAEV